jgi:hypothetical protein
MQNIKLHWIEIILLVALLVFFGVYVKNQGDKFGGRSSGGDSAQSELVVFDGVGTMASIASYDGGDDTIITDAAHGLVVGDVVRFNTSSAAFGGNDAPGFAENTNYYVITASVSTIFEVSTIEGGTALDLTVASSGGAEWITKEFSETGEIDVNGSEFKTITINAEEAPSVSLTIVGSDMDTPPDWYASQSTTNRFDNVAVYDLQNNTELEGDTGIAITGADTNSIYQVYANNLKWLFVKSSNYASGSVDIRIKGF